MRYLFFLFLFSLPIFSSSIEKHTQYSQVFKCSSFKANLEKLGDCIFERDFLMRSHNKTVNWKVAYTKNKDLYCKVLEDDCESLENEGWNNFFKFSFPVLYYPDPDNRELIYLDGSRYDYSKANSKISYIKINIKDKLKELVSKEMSIKIKNIHNSAIVRRSLSNEYFIVKSTSNNTKSTFYIYSDYLKLLLSLKHIKTLKNRVVIDNKKATMEWIKINETLLSNIINLGNRCFRSTRTVEELHSCINVYGNGKGNYSVDQVHNLIKSENFVKCNIGKNLCNKFSSDIIKRYGKLYAYMDNDLNNLDDCKIYPEYSRSMNLSFSISCSKECPHSHQFQNIYFDKGNLKDGFRINFKSICTAPNYSM